MHFRIWNVRSQFDFPFLFPVSPKAYLLQFRKLDTQTMGKNYIVPAGQIDTLRRRKCWEKERKIHGSGEKRLLYGAGMVVESRGMVEVSHEDVTYIQCTIARYSLKWEKPCMTVLSLSQSRVNDREVNLGWCTHRTLSPFRIGTPEHQDNQQLLVDRSGRLSVRSSVLGYW